MHTTFHHRREWVENIAGKVLALLRGIELVFLICVFTILPKNTWSTICNRVLNLNGYKIQNVCGKEHYEHQKESRQPTIAAFNHSIFLDHCILYKTLEPLPFVAKPKYIPSVIIPLAKKMNFIFTDTNEPVTARICKYIHSYEDLDQPLPLAIAPAAGSDFRKVPFRTGAFVPRDGCEILPIVITYVYPPQGRDDSFFEENSLVKWLYRRCQVSDKCHVYVDILPPMNPENDESPTDYAERVRQRMLRVYDARHASEFEKRKLHEIPYQGSKLLTLSICGFLLLAAYQAFIKRNALYASLCFTVFVLGILYHSTGSRNMRVLDETLVHSIGLFSVMKEARNMPFEIWLPLVTIGAMLYVLKIFGKELIPNNYVAYHLLFAHMPALLIVFLFLQHV